MNERLRRLRDAIVGRDREVEVDENGTVREIPEREADEREERESKVPERRATKLARRTFGTLALSDDPGPIDFYEITDVLAALAPRLQVVVIVPSRDREGRRIDFKKLVLATEATLLAVATGMRITRSHGIWRGALGLTVRERVAAVEVFFPEEVLPAHRDAVLICLTRILREGNQEAVEIIIDGRLYLLSEDTIIRRAA